MFFRLPRLPRLVWLPLLLAHALALAWAGRTRTWYFPDTDRYQQAARNLLAHGQLYARPWPAQPPQGKAVQEFTIRPPGYPLVLAALGGSGARPWVVLLLQNALSLANLCLVLGWWGRRFRPGPRQWALALALALTWPAQLIYASAVMSEVLLQSLVLAMTVLAWRFWQHGRSRDFAGVGLALGAAFMLKPVFFPLAGVLAGAGLALAWHRRRPRLALLGLLPALLALAYMGRNYERTGDFHFSSISTINLLTYNAAGVVRQTAGPVAESRWLDAALAQADAQPTFAARQRLMQAQAWAVLRAHPAACLGQQAQGMVAFFLDPGRFDVSQFLRLPPPPGGGLLAQVRAGHLAAALRRLPWGLLLGLAALALLNAARLGLAVRGFGRLGQAGGALKTARWLALGLLLYVAVLTGPLGAARFLVPVWPLLLGLALVGMMPAPKPAC